MDEIDAALDFKNVSIVANYIKDRTRDAQFIIISLRSNMFELADRLVGIYKTDNCSKSITIVGRHQSLGRITLMCADLCRTLRNLPTSALLYKHDVNSDAYMWPRGKTLLCGSPSRDRSRNTAK